VRTDTRQISMVGVAISARGYIPSKHPDFIKAQYKHHFGSMSGYVQY
jgi:hypothetical protein